MRGVVPALLFIGSWLPALSGEVAAQQGTAARVYELRTYTTHPDRLDALIQRFENRTRRLFEKHEMESVGYSAC